MYADFKKSEIQLEICEIFYIKLILRVFLLLKYVYICHAINHFKYTLSFPKTIGSETRFFNALYFFQLDSMPKPK